MLELDGASLTAPDPDASRMVVHLRPRVARITLLFGALGAVVAASGGAAPPRDVDSLARALGAAANGDVAPDEIRWEPSLGWLSDYLHGRRALFLARRDGAPRDVWRARVRLSPEGRPLEVVDAHDLTDTELGDDHALVADGRYAAFATSVYGQEQSVSLLDLEGEGAENQATTLSDRAMACITNVQKTGACDGIGRIDVVFESPARAVGLALSEAALAIELADARSRRSAVLDFNRGDIVPAVEGLHAEAALHLPKRLSHWAVDTVRAVPWIGGGADRVARGHRLLAARRREAVRIQSRWTERRRRPAREQRRAADPRARYVARVGGRGALAAGEAPHDLEIS